MQRTDLWRIVAIAGLIGLVITLLALVLRPSEPTESLDGAPVPSTADDLGPALRRCAAITQGDPDLDRCNAIWAENRRRFFGAPPRPLPAGTLTPTSGTEGAR